VSCQENLVAVLTVEGLQFPQNGSQLVINIQGIHRPAKSGRLRPEELYQLLVHAQNSGSWAVDGVENGLHQDGLIGQNLCQVNGRGWRRQDNVLSSIFVLVYFLIVKMLPPIGLRSFSVQSTGALVGPDRAPGNHL
jgi:hypothetical protein